MERDTLTLLETRNLMLECLAYECEDIDSEGNTFKKYGYKGTQNDLFRLMESLAIKKELISSEVPVRNSAWGSSGSMMHPMSTTNFTYDEINHIYESFHFLLNLGIISPGAVGNMGPNLPNFHVTKYGKRCLAKREILPYDVDDYLAELNSIDNLDEWVNYYIKQALMCYNANCIEASLIMVGLANEVITDLLVGNYCDYLDKKYANEKSEFELLIKKKRTISQKYLQYRNHLKSFSMKKDYDLKNLRQELDELANDTYLSYLRLTRNELAHPTEFQVDRITALMIFISLIKYCERQYKFINYFKNCA